MTCPRRGFIGEIDLFYFLSLCGIRLGYENFLFENYLIFSDGFDSIDVNTAKVTKISILVWIRCLTFR